MIDITKPCWTVSGDRVTDLKFEQGNQNSMDWSFANKGKLLTGTVELRDDYDDGYGKYVWELDGWCITGSKALILTNEPPVTPHLNDILELTDKLNYIIKEYKKIPLTVEQCDIIDKILENLNVPYRMPTTND